jgi:hypothetical protein
MRTTEYKHSRRRIFFKFWFLFRLREIQSPFIRDIFIVFGPLVYKICRTEGELQCPHRNPVSRRRRRKRNPVPGGITGPPCHPRHKYSSRDLVLQVGRKIDSRMQSGRIFWGRLWPKKGCFANDDDDCFLRYVIHIHFHLVRLIWHATRAFHIWIMTRRSETKVSWVLMLSEWLIDSCVIYRNLVLTLQCLWDKIICREWRVHMGFEKAGRRLFSVPEFAK